jgi:hypothetical protein
LDHFSSGTNLLPKKYKEGEEGKLGGETEEWLRFRYYMNYSEGSLMALMLVGAVAQRRCPVSPNRESIITNSEPRTHRPVGSILRKATHGCNCIKDSFWLS